MLLNIASTVRSLCLVVLSVIVTVSTPQFVSAAAFTAPPEINNRQKAHLDIAHTGGGDSCAESSVGATGSTMLTGKDNFEMIYNFLRDKGLSPEQAAGAIGNIKQESGGDPTIIQGGKPVNLNDNKPVSEWTFDSKHTKSPAGISSGWGLIQWTPGSKIIGIAKEANVSGDIYRLGTQLEIVWWHMNNTSPTGVKNMYATFKNIKTLEEATLDYETRMEGAGDKQLAKRVEFAKEILRQYGGGGSTTSSTSDESTSASTCSSGSVGGTVSANGFTFPLKATKQMITTNKGAQWCFEKTTNCHHDYNAADIHVPTGTTVVAAKDGVVQNVKSGNRHPNNVTITSTDKKGINYYTHMGANTVVVREGQPVKGGETLGKVGTEQDAMGTNPHLHFDMMPPKYPSRVNCSGASCTPYEFIDVQPVLIELFKKLPES